MSNPTRTGGLVLHKSVVDQELKMCIALSGDSTLIGIGDAVKLSAAGATNVGSGPTVPAITRAAAGDSLYGVVVSVVPLIEGTGALNMGIRHRPVSTAQYVNVRPANYNDEYRIIDDGSAALTKANIGNNANLVVADCDTTTGMSNMKIDATSVASGNATRQLHVIGYVDSPDNDQSSTGAQWIVTLNNIYQGGGTGVIGI